VFFAAIDQLISSWERDKFQLVYDENVPARSSEFKVKFNYLTGFDSELLIMYKLDIYFQ
jgi:hypothetical protein